MHLVFLNQYYPPDAAPTGVMLEAVAEECAQRGHEVTVLCAAGGYGEKFASVQSSVFKEKDEAGAKRVDRNSTFKIKNSTFSILRIGATRFGRASFIGKLVDYFSYYLGVAWRLGTMSPRPDRIVALTTPPYLSVLARVMSKFRRGDHAHWVMDLYPDVMAAHGMLNEGSLPYRVLSVLARWGCGGKRCAAVMTLGPDMADRLRRSFKFQDSSFQQEESCAPGSFSHSTFNIQNSPFKIQWVPLWGEGESRIEVGRACRTLRRQRGWADDELVVMYSGNMGLGHRFSEILEVAAGLRPAVAPYLVRLRFVFYGGGKRRREIEDFMGEHPGVAVELHDYVAAADLTDHLASADVHLVSLDPAWTGTMVPSKLQGVFAVGRPVIFIGSPESSLGKWVAESGGGWVVAPDDVNSLLVALEEASDPEQRAACGEAAKAFAVKHFDKATNVARVAEALLG